MDKQFTEQLQLWLSQSREERDWDAGALMLLQLSGNKIMYHNISVNPIGKAEFIEGKLQQYLDFRLAELTHEQVKEMQQQVADIVQEHTEFKSDDNEAKSFKAGKRADHDSLPDEIKALYVENLDLVHRMRELHLKLRTMSTSDSACADSDRYPFLKEFIKLDKKLHDNWNVYDHFVTKEEKEESEENETNATNETDVTTETPTPSSKKIAKKSSKSQAKVSSSIWRTHVPQLKDTRPTNEGRMSHSWRTWLLGGFKTTLQRHSANFLVNLSTRLLVN